MGHKFNVGNKQKLDNPERRRILPPYETLQNLGLQSGDIMADIGCGIGYFTLPASQLVGTNGRVYALDISPEMLSDVRDKAQHNQLHNITTIQIDENKFPLASGLITFGFAAFVLHETNNLRSFLLEFKRILHKSGKIAVIEWEKKETKMGPPLDHRLAKQDLQKLLQEIWFINIRNVSLDDSIYALIAENN